MELINFLSSVGIKLKIREMNDEMGLTFGFQCFHPLVVSKCQFPYNFERGVVDEQLTLPGKSQSALVLEDTLSPL